MRKIIKYLLLLPLIGGAFVFSSKSSDARINEVSAQSITPYPYSGGDTSILFVNGGVFGKDAPVAICVWNSSGSAWSNKVDYTVNGSYPVVVPPPNGSSWVSFKITRYNPSLEPTVDGQAGVYNESDTKQFGNFRSYGYNTIRVTGYTSDNKLSVSDSLSVTKFSGVKGDTHFYLDLKDCSWWENDYAKFAIYFAHSNYFGKKEDWSLSNSSEGYYLAFMWKVQGQDNDHLYECIVPGGSTTIWNLAIAVRFDPVQGYPGWYNYWNQTADINFNESNNEANMIYLNSDGVASINPEHAISKATRLNFYGQYFLDTVSCSGNGNSDATTSSQWDAVKAEYNNHLSFDFRGGVWTTLADKTGSTIAQAMYRYDYILFYKHYEHEDFINRADPNSGYKPLSSNEYVSATNPFVDNKKSTIYIVIIALASISSVGLLIVAKRKKALK